ncbi:hypothetical protein UFOVP653_9 [uncultured Caudovirales phage]|uniref:Uncharacterized protein n=1 Tax=uncultured Caudovirales phage TaxID=2100421 RepID=A0A6J5NC30_9CAUD|nr:hypothetical protein UFOVP653_9 [uncultured Caudovirales phage]
MTKEEIIRMALEAGLVTDKYDAGFMNLFTQKIERFAALVAAAERERIAAWVEDMCAGLDAKTIANGIRNGGNDDIRAFEVKK